MLLSRVSRTIISAIAQLESHQQVCKSSASRRNNIAQLTCLSVGSSRRFAALKGKKRITCALRAALLKGCVRRRRSGRAPPVTTNEPPTKCAPQILTLSTPTVPTLLSGGRFSDELATGATRRRRRLCPLRADLFRSFRVREIKRCDL